MSDTVIKVENVSKKYCRSIKHTMLYGTTDLARSFLGLNQHTEILRNGEFWAVDDVSFELKRGETLGIIGPNGSGKSTMLKMLNGIFMPDKGRIEIKGRVGALIEVGAGFHPMLTGRENIYVNGSILGMTKKEMDERFDEIVAFADIGDFIDSPVKHYSSGMNVRLGVAVATCLQPEVLLIDEVLSVGDLSFQNKSLRRLAEIRENANAVVFVSHNLEHIRNLCQKVMVINNGNSIFWGNPQEAVLKYHEISRQKRLLSLKDKKGVELFKHVSSGDIVINEVGILNEFGNKTDQISVGEDIRIFFELELKRNMDELYFSVGVVDERIINCIWQMSNDNNLEFRNISKGKYRLTVNYKKPNLAPGVYSPTFAVRNGISGEIYEKMLSLVSFRVEGNIIPRGIIHAESKWGLCKIG